MILIALVVHMSMGPTYFEVGSVRQPLYDNMKRARRPELSEAALSGHPYGAYIDAQANSTQANINNSKERRLNNNQTTREMMRTN